MTASAALARADQRWCRLAAGGGIRVTTSMALMLWGLPHPRHLYQCPGPGRGSRAHAVIEAGVSHGDPFSRPFLNDCQSFADESMIALRAPRGAEQRGWERTCRSSVLSGARHTRWRP